MTAVGVRARGLLVATHAGPAAVVTLLALSLSVGIGSGVGTATLVTLAVLAGQVSVGWSNDWLDAGRDRAVGRTDKPSVAGAVTPDLLRTCAVAALAVCVVLSFATGWVAGSLHVLAVAGAWSYNAWFKSTVLSWLPYAVSFGLLAAFVVAAPQDGRVVAWWAVLGAALLGVGAHVANVLPDLEDDRATGVRGFPHRLGRRGASVAAPALLVAASLVVVLGPERVPGTVTVVCGVLALALAVAAGVVGATRPRSRAPFALSMGVAALCVVQLVAAAPYVAVA
ncbi:UbiA family prenyltransferase [Cellulomonas sp. PhB143]|uniref:UbiA family prenyltransferase n=1 Tax=Cellulomonas sp. PhB143 TaxID=2485186 RepID=UPI000F49EC2E|nr:UbiA family prenyltransferase [Cellulomonas sp. PhB143]ROS75302.1 4-hydroxybenzoate polyprenyltransferase [Cellulomonas sp. PhB143]